MLIYVPGTPNSHYDLSDIKRAGRGIYSFTLEPNELANRFRKTIITGTFDSYEDAMNFAHSYVTDYSGKKKMLSKYTNATISEITWQRDENDQLDYVDNGNVVEMDMADTMHYDPCGLFFSNKVEPDITYAVVDANELLVFSSAR